jgi:formate C-acetyltransferase
MEAIMEKTRTEEFRKTAFDNGHHRNNWIEREYLVSRAYLETAGEQFHNLRRAKMDCVLFDNYSIEITPRELLAGRYSHSRVLTPEEEEIRFKGREAMKYGGDISGYHEASTGHRVLDYEKLLNKGAKSILAQLEAKRSALDFSRSEDTEKAVFYEASKISLEGFCRFAGRFHEKLAALAATESDPVQKAEYLGMAGNFKKAPWEPCTSFYEALQTVFFVQFAMNIIGDTSLAGRLDSLLYPFYRKDIDSGALTKEFAFELIENFYYKQNEIYDTWPGSLMVGGVDRLNRPVWNEITEMCIAAIETTGLINPSVSVAYTKDMPGDLLDKCIGIIAKGYTKPSIFNDRIIRQGLEDAGVTPEDAREYIHSTCVEITPIACSNILVATPYINPTKALEYILGKGKPLFGGECGMANDIPLRDEDLNDFEGFYKTVKAVMAEIIRKALIEDCAYALKRARYQSSPLSSALLNDCIELGKDSGAGGAKYNFIYPCFPGYVTLVDSLRAIKTAVYDEKKLSLEELGRLCKTDFKDEERMRLYLVNRCAKFGNDDDETDAIGKDFFDFLKTELARYRHCLGKAATFHPSYFAWIQHGMLGRIAAATPNGRRQGEALSENLGASQGMDRNSPLGVVRSIAKLDQRCGIGGIATNFRFSKSFLAGAEGRKALADFIRYFMDSGCFEIQFNVVDQNTLLDAKANPEKYSTLMVRVAGYSDYFTNLAPEIQDEIIRRTEHDGV